MYEFQRLAIDDELPGFHFFDIPLRNVPIRHIISWVSQHVQIEEAQRKIDPFLIDK